MRVVASVALELGLLALAASPLPLPVRIAASCAALLVPAFLVGRMLLPGSSFPVQALLASSSALVLALALNLVLQAAGGIGRWGLAGGLLLVTAIAALAETPKSGGEGWVVAALAGASAGLAAVAALLDPNGTQLVAYDAWFTFQGVRQIFDSGGIEVLGWYPRGVHYFFATPLVLVGDGSVGAMIAAVYPYRVFNLASLSLGAYCLARELRLGTLSALACGLVVFLFNPGGLPSSWHVMPRASGLVLIPTMLILIARLLSKPQARVFLGAAGFLAASVYVHQFIAFQLALAILLGATLLRPWLAPATLIVVALFAAVTFDPPQYFDVALRVPGLDVLFVGKYYAVDPVSYHPFSFYPLPFTLTVALAAVVATLVGSREERLVGLFALCLFLASANSFVSERWYASLHALALLLVLVAARKIPRPWFRRAVSVAGALLVATAVLTQTAYASWAQGTAEPEDLALYEAADRAGLAVLTDRFNELQVLAATGNVTGVDGVFRTAPEKFRAPTSVLITGRTTRAFYNRSETLSVLPQPFLAHPALVPFANQSVAERLFATPDGDHLLLRIDPAANRTVPPTVLVLEDPVAESLGNDRSKWVAQVALFRLGVQFRTVNSTSLRSTSFDGIDTVVVPTNEILRRLQYEYPARTHLEDFLENGGRLVAVGGSYGELAPMLGVRGPIAFKQHTSEVRWQSPNGSAATAFEYPVEMHRYDVDPRAEVLARDPDGFPIVWRVRVGNGTAVLSPLQNIGAGDDVFRFLKALWLFGHGRDDEALAAAVVPPPPGYAPWHEPAYAFYTSWRDLQAPYNAGLRPLLLWGALSTVAAWAIRETVLALRGRAPKAR